MMEQYLRGKVNNPRWENWLTGPGTERFIVRR